jgi:hypothetical protein
VALDVAGTSVTVAVGEIITTLPDAPLRVTVKAELGEVEASGAMVTGNSASVWPAGTETEAVVAV